MTQTATTKTAPGPKGLPVIGNVMQLGGADILTRYIELWKEYGDIFYLKLGPLDSFVLANPEHVHHVLVKNQTNYIKGIGYDGFRLLVGQGLVTSDGELWRQQRRLMQPPFTPKAITQFTQMMVDVTAQMLDRWQAYAQRSETVTMDAEMMRLTMSIIGRAMFSIDLGEELTEVGDALHRAFGFIPERAQGGIALPLSVPTPKHRRFKQDLEIIDGFIQRRIEEGRRNPNQDNLLSILLQSRDEETGQGMSEEQLRDEVVTLFFAGFETTARSLTWALYLIAHHPEVADKLEAESDAVLQGRAPVVDDLFNLTYTRMVVDEVLRLYPPTALLARQNVADDVIGGYPVPAKSMIVLIPFLIHRYPSVWPDAERFDPERFRPEAVDARPRNAYIPFASGPRVCLGNNFALMEMTLALSMIAARYRLSQAPLETIPHEFAGTIRPTKALRMKIEAR
ncbi:MAG: cytochrome P450 [Caldilineaceae bacterium]|nr:cytochrome P450 [Caldilineaceae bacterium]